LSTKIQKYSRIKEWQVTVKIRWAVSAVSSSVPV
jgi:hypothetical protein